MSGPDDSVGGAATTDEQQPPEGKRKFTFPSALTVLAVFSLAVWLLAFLVPPGQYERNDDGAPVQGTYHRVESTQTVSNTSGPAPQRIPRAHRS